MSGRRRLLAPLCATLALAYLVAAVTGTRVGAVGEGGLVAQPTLSAPAETFLGASPGEAQGEVWATAHQGSTIARFSDAGGWQILPPPLSAEGGPIAGLRFLSGAAAGRTTPAGGVVAAATSGSGQILVVRDPGGGFREAPDPEPLLEPGETLFPEAAAPQLAAVPEESGHTGAYVVPAIKPATAPTAVLAFDGESWSREQICVGATAPASVCNPPPKAFRPIAIDATAAGNAWLLGRKAATGQGLSLFERDPGSGQWRQRSLGPEGSPGALFSRESIQVPRPGKAPLAVSVLVRTSGQPLTVSDGGVWFDARLTAAGETTDATLFFDPAKGEVTASWCDVPETSGLCSFPLGQELPAGEARSFAWSGSGEFGTRVVTGVGEGAILSLEGTTFVRLPLSGGDSGTELGAALASPESGWLGDEPPLHLVRSDLNPEPSQLKPWPVPFRRPLTAIAAEPGAKPGALTAQAVAVGDQGQVARFLPGQGWSPEALLTASGKRATPTLRGVAWPTSGFAYAVGDGAEMWLWRAGTGLWEPDPGKPPNLVRANFTGIAFDPRDPDRGYAIGKQGVLLGYGKEWTQEQLPAGLNPEANFTSIAFAGDEALVTYKFPKSPSQYEGGLIVNDGSGWRLEPAAATILGGIPEKVAGLPDGGAVIASAATNEDMTVAEREGSGGAWQRVPENLRGYPSALAAIREGGRVQAIVSVDRADTGASTQNRSLSTDLPQIFNQPPAGQAPLFTHPYPLPANGFVVRQTGSVWRDEQHEALPAPARGTQPRYDWPVRPDPDLALLLAPDGSQGWAVGGVTGEETTGSSRKGIQTGSAMRYGPEAAPPANVSGVPIASEAGTATFAIGGNAQCGGPCADLAGTGTGPDRWLRGAVAKAAGIPGVRAFLYTGPGVAAGDEKPLAATISSLAFGREESSYAQRLAGNAGSLPIFAAAAETDLDRKKTLATFATAFSGYGAPLGGAPPAAGVSPLSQASTTQGYYSFESAGAGGKVRVVVLDYSATSLGSAQQCWLAGQLAEARSVKTPAVVVGDRDLGGQSVNKAADAALVTRILVGGEPPAGCVVAGTPGAASAYFFNFPEEDRQYRLSSGGKSVPAYGSGTLGYVFPPVSTNHQFLGASGFLLASVRTAERDPATNVAPVQVRLIPNVGSLALDAKDGTLLRRSQVALFEALSRRPLAGMLCLGRGGQACTFAPDPYIPIPSICQGPKCATGLLPEYRFSSSRPDIADFVKTDPASANPRAVLLGKGGKPILDASSGLLCAFNAGTTTVTIEAGGLTYSMPVTVQKGSVQRPCGTVPLGEGPVPQPSAVPPPVTQPQPGFETPPGSLPPPPPPIALQPAPAPAPTPAPAPAPTPPAFFAPTPGLTPIVPIVPPPGPPAVEPTPPSGTSPVTQPAVSPEPEEEEEAAFDIVHNMAAYEAPRPRPAFASPAGSSRGPSSLYAIPALVLLTALAGAGLTRRRPRPKPAYAFRTTPRRPSR